MQRLIWSWANVCCVINNINWRHPELIPSQTCVVCNLLCIQPISVFWILTFISLIFFHLLLVCNTWSHGLCLRGWRIRNYVYIYFTIIYVIIVVFWWFILCLLYGSYCIRFSFSPFTVLVLYLFIYLQPNTVSLYIIYISMYIMYVLYTFNRYYWKLYDASRIE